MHNSISLAEVHKRIKKSIDVIPFKNQVLCKYCAHIYKQVKTIDTVDPHLSKLIGTCVRSDNQKVEGHRFIYRAPFKYSNKEHTLNKTLIKSHNLRSPDNPSGQILEVRITEGLL